jgi:hypothetical protein
MVQYDEELSKLFEETEDFNVSENVSDIADTPILNIDLDEVNSEATKMATLITERLSNYYFDEEYIKNHPYIPTKIMTAMDNIRRLLKMLSINEKAQDNLIANISFNAGKGALYSSLTSLQNSMLSIQTQLNNLTESIENIFREMQAECEKSFAEKEKDNESEVPATRGSRDFIKQLQERLYGKLTNEGSEIIDKTTGEVANF